MTTILMAKMMMIININTDISQFTVNIVNSCTQCNNVQYVSESIFSVCMKMYQDEWNGEVARLYKVDTEKNQFYSVSVMTETISEMCYT